MIDTLNIIAALLTIAFGAYGFLAPRRTAKALDLIPGDTTMGLSELRASVGGLFVIMALACLMLNDPMAYATMGFAYAGATLGRFLSIALDKAPAVKAGIFGAIEGGLALWLIAANL